MPTPDACGKRHGPHQELVMLALDLLYEEGRQLKGGWVRVDQLAEETGLRVGQVRAALYHMKVEYGAVQDLPSGTAVRLLAAGRERWDRFERLFHPDRLWPKERSGERSTPAALAVA